MSLKRVHFLRRAFAIGHLCAHHVQEFSVSAQDAGIAALVKRGGFVTLRRLR
jgi:hypothetical protein